MQHRRRMIGYAIPEEIAADCLFETQGNVAEAQRLARLISLARTTTGTYRGSTSLKARTGMGVRADGKVICAMSQGEVSFDAFGRLFRDGLLVPRLRQRFEPYTPSLNSHGNILSLGPIGCFAGDRGASGTNQKRTRTLMNSECLRMWSLETFRPRSRQGNRR
jgi:hypothetical protein